MLKRVGIDGALTKEARGVAFGPMHPDAPPSVRDLMATLHADENLPEKISTLVLQTYRAKHGKTLRVVSKDDDEGHLLDLGESGAESGVDE